MIEADINVKKNICIIDFGAGNLHSVFKAFKFIGADVEVTKDSEKIKKSDLIVFPGVGAFGAVMDSINKNNLTNVIIEQAVKKPFLGICMGLQVLFEESEESPSLRGLGVLKGKVIKFKKAKKVPHIGWNTVIARNTEGATKQSHYVKPSGDCFVGTNVSPRNDNRMFYFVHSYYVVPNDKNIISCETEYDGEKFVSTIKKDNLFAVQFHPEKSGDAGLELLKSFIKPL